MSVVVCPLSGLPNAERALPTAFDAAHLFEGELELFSAVEDQHMVDRQEKYLHRIGLQRRGSGAPAPTTAVVVDPHAPRAIAERASTASAFVVMATSSQPLLHSGYLGSAAERVTRDAPNATMLVGPHNMTRLGDAERVVVPCDGSPLSEAALSIGKEWAERLDVELWLITSISPRDTNQPGYDPSAATNYVQRLALGMQAQWEVLHGPDAAKSIAKWAGPALIVMTTHGRSGLSRLTVGSVTTGVVRWANGPVLVANSRACEQASN